MMKEFNYILPRILPAAAKAARWYGSGVTGFAGKTQALMVSAIKCKGYTGGKVIEPPGREGSCPDRALIPDENHMELLKDHYRLNNQ